MKLTQELLNKFENNFKNDKTNKIVYNALAMKGKNEASINYDVLRKHNFVWNVETKKGEITNQKRSGRCWIFATLNVARVKVIEKLNLKTFEFSQNYLAFFDKLEKSNVYLSYVSDLADQPLNDRLLYTFLKEPISDGGYFEWCVSLIKKYGVVPSQFMPDTFHSGQTDELNKIITLLLLKATKEIRALNKQERAQKVNAIKEDYLNRIYNVTAKFFGLPPKEFQFEFKDKDDKFVRLEKTTPIEFFEKYVGEDFYSLVNLISDPRKIHPYGSKYRLKYQKNLVEADVVEMINVPLDELKRATIKSLQAGEAVWFACDVNPFKDNKLGIFDPELFDYENYYGDLHITKADRIDFYNSNLNHAMAFVGVNLDDNGNPLTWKVENSWGKEQAKEGIYSMSDSWFNEYNFTVLVDKKFVDKKYLNDDNNKVVELDLWDPLA